MAGGTHGQARGDHRTQTQDRRRRTADRHHPQQGDARGGLPALALRRHAPGLLARQPHPLRLAGGCGAAQGRRDRAAGVGHPATHVAPRRGADPGRGLVRRCAHLAGRRCRRQDAQHLGGGHHPRQRLASAPPGQYSLRQKDGAGFHFHPESAPHAQQPAGGGRRRDRLRIRFHLCRARHASVRGG